MYAAVTSRTYGEIDFIALQSALNNGYILGSADGASLFAPVEEVKDTNQLEDVDLRGTRTLTELPGGPLSLGTGIGYYHTLPRLSGGSRRGERRQFGSVAYAVRLTEQLRRLLGTRPPRCCTSLSSMARCAGTTTTPTAARSRRNSASSTRRMRQVTFRATCGQGFRAPNPAEAGRRAVCLAGWTTPIPILCKQTAAGQQLPGSFPYTCIEFPTGLQITNPNLRPEQSSNYTLAASS